jgi:cytochrome P450
VSTKSPVELHGQRLEKAARPPMPRFWDNIRTVTSFGRDPAGWVVSLQNRTTGLLRLRTVDMFLIYAADPVLVGEILVDHAGNYQKDEFTHDLEMLLGSGLLTSEGALWKKQRKLIAPSLQPRQIASYRASMVRIADQGLRDLREQENMHDRLMRVTLDIVVETLFGAELSEEDAAVGHIIEQVMNDYVVLQYTPRRLLPQWIYQPVRRRIARGSAHIRKIIQRLIAQKRAGDLSGDDLLTRLLLARDEQGLPMDENQLQDEIVTMFLAGHETTALTLGYSLYLLAGDSQRQEKAAAAAVSDGPGDYIDDVIRESLRLYPPAWTIGREALHDHVLGGMLIKKKDTILISPFAMHRDARWFPDPLDFKPERWQAADESLPRYAYMPFGGGPRVCVGNHFALMEASIVLRTLLRRYRFSRVERIELAPSITLRPRAGVMLNIEQRKPC